MSRDLIEQWLVDALGTRVDELRLLSGGGLSRETWLVTGRLTDGTVLDGVLKRDTGVGPLSGTAFTPAREAAALRAVAGTGVAVPAVLGVAPDMFLMQRLAGSTDVDAAPAGLLCDGVAANAAALHGLDVTGLALPDSAPTVHAATLANLDEFEKVDRALATSSSVLEDAFSLARSAVPADPSPPVLVHGDLGPGNLLHEEGRITGLVDWELWHLGDPMDDLASLWFRKCVLRRDDDLTDWYHAYARASGRPLDEGRLRYYRMVTMLRVVVAVRVMTERDPERNEAVAGMMLPLLVDLVKDAS
jgi:aminoglycoside phosphotransferase (APT) family kinase protein